MFIEFLDVSGGKVWINPSLVIGLMGVEPNQHRPPRTFLILGTAGGDSAWGVSGITVEHSVDEVMRALKGEPTTAQSRRL